MSRTLRTAAAFLLIANGAMAQGATAESIACTGGPAGASYVLLTFETGPQRVRVILDKSLESLVVPYTIAGDGFFFSAKDKDFHFDPGQRLLTVRAGDGRVTGHAHCAP